MATDEQARTVELPLTPAHIEALRHHVWSQRRWFLGVCTFAGAAALLLALLALPGMATSFWNALIGPGFVAGATLVADWLFWRRPLAAAIRAGSYLRTTGPIWIHHSTSTEADGSVRVGDVRIEYVPNDICYGLRNLPWGAVDYVPRVHVVIEQRDADGELLYRYPGYRPD